MGDYPGSHPNGRTQPLGNGLAADAVSFEEELGSGLLASRGSTLAKTWYLLVDVHVVAVTECWKRIIHGTYGGTVVRHHRAWDNGGN